MSEAAGGNEALQLWSTNAPDLIFLDLRMHEMNGLEVTSHIRADEARRGARRTRIVIVSASALEHERAAALSRGADAFLAKPFREGGVFGQLENLLGIAFLREMSGEPATPEVEGAMNSKRLAKLPADLRERLAAAASGGEGELVQALAAQVAALDAALGDELALLAREYRFDEIETALSACRAPGEETRS